MTRRSDSSGSPQIRRHAVILAMDVDACLVQIRVAAAPVKGSPCYFAVISAWLGMSGVPRARHGDSEISRKALECSTILDMPLWSSNLYVRHPPIRVEDTFNEMASDMIYV
jgi:hypothetical protein